MFKFITSMSKTWRRLNAKRVMREGRVVEEGPCDRLFAAPGAAYTRMLIDAIPLPMVDPGWLSRGAALEAASHH